MTAFGNIDEQIGRCQLPRDRYQVAKSMQRIRYAVGQQGRIPYQRRATRVNVARYWLWKRRVWQGV